MKKTIISITIILSILSMFVSLPAMAYNRTNAVNYAESYAENPNSSYRYYGSSGDCTNFTSQCLYAGGESMVTGTQDSYYVWWYNNFSTSWTWDDVCAYNWSLASRSYDWQTQNSSPTRGQLKGTYPGTTSVPYPSGVSAGDLFYYDWYGYGEIDHSSIYVCNGTDPDSGYSGALIDQHSNNIAHEIWSLSYRNTDRNTTTIYCVHMY
ncbi:MAG: putative amidase domain protein [Pelotomaculum sp. PtaU1.Bin035]|nr:MAG: putative amidase domain protein [Pelotomaculum sp. PtaU1.Bin035]